MMIATGNWVGAILEGRYRVEAQLGQGGMAYVYRAQEERLGREVVIKVPRETVLADPEFAGRFSREIRSLVHLEHPAVVKVLDVGEHQGVPYLVLQYLSGGSLRDRYPGGLRLDPSRQTDVLDKLADATAWLETIAGALDFMHQRGFLHRDVKPDNILFDAHNHPYLSDFGIVKALTQAQPTDSQSIHTSAGMVIGTPQYMAPELLLGRPCDGRLDQYSLAVTVYELLAGRRPFEGTTPAAIVLQQTRQKPPDLTSLLPGAPRSLAAVLRQALSVDPAERFPSCTQLAQAIQQSLKKNAEGRGQAARAARPEHFPKPAPSKTRSVTHCPRCRAAFPLPPEAAGKRVRCGKCQTVFRPDSGEVLEGKAEPPVAILADVVAVGDRPGKSAGSDLPTRPVQQSTVQTPPLAVAVVVEATEAAVPVRRPPRRARVGSLAWTLPRVLLGAALGGWMGYCLLNLAPRTQAYPQGQARGEPQWQTWLLISLTWTLLGTAAVALGLWKERRRMSLSSAGLLTLASVGALLAAGLTAVGLAVGPWVGGAMGLVYSLAILGGTVGLLLGHAQGGHLAHGLGGAVVGVVLGEVLAAALLAIDWLELDRRIAIGVVAVFGVLWAITLVRLLLASWGATFGSCLAIAVGLGGLLRFTLALPDEITCFPRQGGTVLTTAISPEGHQGLSAGEDESLRWWDLAGRTPRDQFRGFPGVQLATAFTSEEEVVAAGADGKVRLRTLSPPGSVQEVRPWESSLARENIACVAFSDNGARVVWGGKDGTLEVWDIKKKTVVATRQTPEGGIVCVDLSWSGEQVLSAGIDGSLHFWDLSRPQRSRTLKEPTTRGIQCVALSADASQAVSGDREGAVRVWDLEQGQEKRRLKGHEGIIRCVCFAGNALRVVSGGEDGTLRVWDVQQEKELRRLEGHRGGVRCLAVSSDGRRALSGGSDETVRLWRLPR